MYVCDILLCIIGTFDDLSIDDLKCLVNNGEETAKVAMIEELEGRHVLAMQEAVTGLEDIMAVWVELGNLQNNQAGWRSSFHHPFTLWAEPEVRSCSSLIVMTP